MSNNHNIQYINKEICNALGCNSISQTEIRLYAGDKKIIISVCNNCLKKFKEDEDNELK